MAIRLFGHDLRLSLRKRTLGKDTGDREWILLWNVANSFGMYTCMQRISSAIWTLAFSHSFGISTKADVFLRAS